MSTSLSTIQYPTSDELRKLWPYLDSREQERLTRLLSPRTTKYVTHRPHAKQLEFLNLNCMEAGYGGAAGGGKSDALLMAALQYVDVPGYSAIIFRKTFTDLSLPGALIDRSQEWLKKTDARWNPSSHQWRFPSGAILAFGYLENENDHYRYLGAEFQFVGFDELTQFQEKQYLYLFSRLRRLQSSEVPLRMRAATNPGGTGHEWVKARFMIGADGTAAHPDRPFIVAKVIDNPSLNRDEYAKSLTHLDAITRQQLMDGYWVSADGGAFRQSWFRYFSIDGDYAILHYPDTERGDVRVSRKPWWFAVVADTASTKKNYSDYTAIGTFAFQSPDMFVWNMFREKMLDSVAIRAIRNVYLNAIPKPTILAVGEKPPSVIQHLREGPPRLSVRAMPEVDSKFDRSLSARNMAHNGNLWILREAAWRSDLEAELLAFTAEGTHAYDDQVDVTSHAATLMHEVTLNVGTDFARQARQGLVISS